MEWKEGNIGKARELYQRALSINSTGESASRCLQVITCHVLHLEIEIDVVATLFTLHCRQLLLLTKKEKKKTQISGLGCSRTENW